ncbi:MAG: hypothetical protein LRZ88_03595 [Candidatus Cloacimonetes bacterium]|nr:hypothetical protein [Candidatus Cloacimonadota bacterium]
MDKRIRVIREIRVPSFKQLSILAEVHAARKLRAIMNIALASEFIGWFEQI